MAQMGAPKTCVLWVSVKAVREEGKGNVVHNPYLGIYY